VRRRAAALTGRVGVVATGGSGALASLVGVAKALEDSGTEVSVYSVCSGSALFGFPLSAGMPPAELTASMRAADYIDVGWREIAALVPTLARGWCGILRGGKLEAFYRRHLGGLTLAQLRTPTYAPVWNVEHNRLDFVGPRTHPDMPVARAVRMAVSFPLFVQPARLDGLSWCDGVGDEYAGDADHGELGELVGEVPESLVLCPGKGHWPLIPSLIPGPVHMAAAASRWPPSSRGPLCRLPAGWTS